MIEGTTAMDSSTVIDSATVIDSTLVMDAGWQWMVDGATAMLTAMDDATATKQRWTVDDNGRQLTA